MKKNILLLGTIFFFVTITAMEDNIITQEEADELARRRQATPSNIREERSQHEDQLEQEEQNFKLAQSLQEEQERSLCPQTSTYQIQGDLPKTSKRRRVNAPLANIASQDQVPQLEILAFKNLLNNIDNLNNEYFTAIIDNFANALNQNVFKNLIMDYLFLVNTKMGFVRLLVLLGYSINLTQEEEEALQKKVGPHDLTQEEERYLDEKRKEEIYKFLQSKMDVLIVEHARQRHWDIIDVILFGLKKPLTPTEIINLSLKNDVKELFDKGLDFGIQSINKKYARKPYNKNKKGFWGWKDIEEVSNIYDYNKAVAEFITNILKMVGSSKPKYLYLLPDYFLDYAPKYILEYLSDRLLTQSYRVLRQSLKEGFFLSLHYDKRAFDSYMPLFVKILFPNQITENLNDSDKEKLKKMDLNSFVDVHGLGTVPVLWYIINIYAFEDPKLLFTLGFLLKNSNIDINAKTSEGETALMIAKRKGFNDVVSLLRSPSTEAPLITSSQGYKNYFDTKSVINKLFAVKSVEELEKLILRIVGKENILQMTNRDISMIMNFLNVNLLLMVGCAGQERNIFVEKLAIGNWDIVLYLLNNFGKYDLNIYNKNMRLAVVHFIEGKKTISSSYTPLDYVLRTNNLLILPSLMDLLIKRGYYTASSISHMIKTSPKGGYPKFIAEGTPKVVFRSHIQIIPSIEELQYIIQLSGAVNDREIVSFLNINNELGDDILISQLRAQNWPVAEYLIDTYIKKGLSATRIYDVFSLLMQYDQKDLFKKLVNAIDPGNGVELKWAVDPYKLRDLVMQQKSQFSNILPPLWNMLYPPKKTSK